MDRSLPHNFEVAPRKRVGIRFRRDLFPQPNSVRLPGGPGVTVSRPQVRVKHLPGTGYIYVSHLPFVTPGQFAAPSRRPSEPRATLARGDLYYRLKVVEVRLPPLRDRREDIPLLVEHFRDGFNAKFKKTIEAISSDVLKAFLKYPWPGNVRELEHTVEHAFVLCSQNVITFDHLLPDFMSAPGIKFRSADETQAVDSHAILDTLDKTDWNKAKAVRSLGIDRVTLYRKIKRYNLTKDTP